MPSKAQAVNKLLIDAGRSDPDTRQRIERAVGEITLEMLSESDGRFSELERTTEIAVDTTTVDYKLPADFFASKDEHEIQDADGEFVGVFTIYPKDEILRRKRDGERLNARVCHIEFSESGYNGKGRGWYLRLGDESEAAYTYVLTYYREPTENDVSIIKDEAMLYAGVRGSLPRIFGEDAAVDLQKYLHKLPGYGEKASRFSGVIPRRPSYRRVKVNRLQHKIGKGN